MLHDFAKFILSLCKLCLTSDKHFELFDIHEYLTFCTLHVVILRY